MVTFLLTIIFGWAGFYRFKKGQIGLGIVYLFTLGLFYIGWIVDVVCTLRDMIVKVGKTLSPAPAPVLMPSPVRPTPVPAPRTATKADELRKYKELLDGGAITKEEYERKKRELLDPEDPSLKYVACAYCGTRNDRDAANCHACGAKLG